MCTAMVHSITRFTEQQCAIKWGSNGYMNGQEILKINVKVRKNKEVRWLIDKNNSCMYEK